MKKLVAIAVIALVVFLTWDKRQTKNESLKNAISDFNQEMTRPVSDKIIPEQNSITQVDSLLTNGFRVIIKNYSTDDISEFIPMQNSDSHHVKVFHRKFNSEIGIAFNQKSILNLNLSAKSFELNRRGNFWESATLQHAWLDEELSTLETVSLNISFINPVSKEYKLYRMQVDKLGNKKLSLIEEQNS